MPKWISVEDAMPEKENERVTHTPFVLISEIFDDQPWAKPTIEVAYRDFRRNQWRARYGQLSGRVTHWMPLPDFPEVDDA
jgi:hypothetical protein